MKTKTISFWITLFLFPISYYCASVASQWIDVYYLDHWERSFGKSGSVHIAVIFGPLFAILASLGYSIGVVLQKRIVLELPAGHVIIVAFLAGLVSPAIVQWGSRLNWINSGVIVFTIFFIAIPMLSTIFLLWLSYLVVRSSSSAHQTHRL